MHWGAIPEEGGMDANNNKKMMSIAGWLSEPFVGMGMECWETVIGKVIEM